jgi:hypothetical protein
MKTKFSIVSTMLLLSLSAVAQPATITLSAGNVYYFRLAAPNGSLDALALWQTPGFVSALNPSTGDDLFFPTSAGGLTTVFHYNDGVNAGWLNQAFVLETTTRNAFLIISKRSGTMDWPLPPGIHFYGSDAAAANVWLTDYRASVVAEAVTSLPVRRHVVRSVTK